MARPLSLLLIVLAGCGDPSRPTDAGADAGRDGGLLSDAGATDAGATDAGPIDAGPIDAGPLDAGPLDASVPDAGVNCPLPDAGSANGWTPEFSPDGCSLASGLGSVWVNGKLVDPLGWQPSWVSPTRIVYNGYRGDGTEGLKYSDAPFTSTGDVTVPVAFGPFGGITELDAAAGLFAAYHAGGDFAVLTSAGHRFPQRMAPSVSESDRAITMLSRDDKSLYLALNGQESLVTVEALGVLDADVQGDWIVWSSFQTGGGRKSRALKRSTGVITDVTASNRAIEFFPRLVPVGGQMWLISYDGGGTLLDRLFLRPLGSTNVVLLDQGEVRYPTARFHPPSGKIRVAWSDGSGASRVTEVDPAALRSPLP